jgi:hypothetical protein
MPEWLETIGVLGGLLAAISCVVVLIWILILTVTGGFRERLERRRQEEEIEERFLDRTQDFK